MKKGFSLVEILVVLGIIVVLAAILFPVTVAALAGARGAICDHQLSQIAKGISMYMDDNDNQPPLRLKALPRGYVKSCPKDKMRYLYNAQFMVISKVTGKPEYAYGFDRDNDPVVKCPSHFYWNGKVSEEETDLYDDDGKFIGRVRYVMPMDSGNHLVRAAFLDGHVDKAPLIDKWQIEAMKSQ